MHWHVAYIALGSNLQQPQQQVRLAFESLASINETRLIARSSLYRSLPMGPQDQPEFINAVAGIITQLDAPSLMNELMLIEQRMGRERSQVWGPRIIDLDLLMFIGEQGEVRSDTEALRLPHPGIAERNFVAVPLAELAPQIKIAGQSATQLAQRLGMNGLVRLS